MLGDIHIQRICRQYIRGHTYKPRGQLRGRGVSQMSILLQMPYLVKVTTKGDEGVSKIPKKFETWFKDDP